MFWVIDCDVLSVEAVQVEVPLLYINTAPLSFAPAVFEVSTVFCMIVLGPARPCVPTVVTEIPLVLLIVI